MVKAFLSKATITIALKLYYSYFSCKELEVIKNYLKVNIPSKGFIQ